MIDSDFIKFINDKTGMDLHVEDMDKELVNIDGWDSLAFVYMILAMEKEQQKKLDIQKFLTAVKLQDIYIMVRKNIK